MSRLSLEDRRAALQRMARDGVEVLVVGGGITGCGVLLELAARGYNAGLIDKGDFASGTSSKSTKLAHGGIRYLAHFDFALVREALIERGRMIRNAPHLTKPLGFVLPLYKTNRRPLDMPFVLPGGLGTSWILQAGLLMYDLMSGKLGIKMHRRLSPDQAKAEAPAIKREGMTSAFIYYDGQTDDTRLTLNVLRTAANKGALAANYTELTSFEQHEGKITAAHIKDCLSGETYKIKTNAIINAGGVFAGRIEAMASGGASGESKISVKPAKGVHLTVPREAVPLGEYAAVLPETPDGRLVFLVPWNTRITIGTTDTKGGDIDQPIATDADVQYLLDVTNDYMQTKLTQKDIISAWAGYRPLISPAGANADTSKLSRSHVVMDGPGGMVTVTGGKLTTYRRMAQDAVDHLANKLSKAINHPTEDMPLDGAQGAPDAAQAVQQAAKGYGWNKDIMTRLNTYGSEACTLLDICKEDAALAKPIVPDLPYIMAEVAYACRNEMAAQLQDVIVRRLHLNFEDWSRGVTSAPAIAQVMARELGWSAAEADAQVQAYQATAQKA